MKYKTLVSYPLYVRQHLTIHCGPSTQSSAVHWPPTGGPAATVPPMIAQRHLDDSGDDQGWTGFRATAGAPVPHSNPSSPTSQDRGSDHDSPGTSVSELA